MALHNGKFIKTTDVVISGISGTFPQSDNMEELKQNLLSGKDMITENNRWETGGDEAHHRMGMIKNLDRFDSSFFRVGRKQVEALSISNRMVLEKVFEAILDAGYNPQQFKGTNTGVFVGFCNDETDHTFNKLQTANEYAALNTLRCISANRISYLLDLRGPSLIIDTACSTGLYGLEMAYKAIQNGNCDAAIICTLNLCVLPFATEALRHMGVVSADGVSRPFDEKASGFVRAEAIIATLMQKKQDAHRIYANVIHAKTNCDGFLTDGLLHPSIDGQSDLFQKFYSEIDVDPLDVTYVEAHGTGTKVGDKVEVDAIEKIFCPRKRTTPLKIGSVKSNLGHTEASAALSSLAKVIITFETGIVPPNINLETLHPKIESFHNGNIEVVTKPTPFEDEYFAINSYGIGGSNGHILLTPNEKIKNNFEPVAHEFPLIVAASGRTEEAVKVILDDVEKNINDAEYIRLWHEIFSEDINGHCYRGYIISTKENQFEKNIKEFNADSRPIWFIFTGMGSQWPTMGKSLMNIPIFAESIRKSHKVLEPKGINLIHIITEDDPIIFKNIMNSFVGIAAIQVALVDILKVVGIEPDGIIGHSVGELGCAYADGCFTAEQMLLAAYYRGLVSLETEFIHGTLAAVGAGYDVIKDLIPPEIDVAAHNGPTSSTISGPTDIVKDFIEELKQKDIFTREVNVSNIPYHSRYIATAEQNLISYMKKIIPAPKLRSEKWICTSASENEWRSDKTKYASAEYFTNNLLNPVYFEEGCSHIPNNAITIEIAPHGLLQAILKRSLPTTIDNISLTLRDCEDGPKFLMNALGLIYTCGVSLKLSNLYPPIQFPVSRKTPMISPLIKWQHEDQWEISKYAKKTSSGERDILIRLKEHEYLRGHVIDGRNLYPATGYLYLVWETLAALYDKKKEGVSVIFENVRFERATNIQKTQNMISFHISVQVGTGHFEISENNATVASGLVRVPQDINLEKIDVIPCTDDVPENNVMPMKTKDFYKALRLRGYHYKGLFKKVQYANINGTYGRVSWNNNFITFMDTMAQISILQQDIKELIIPTFIRKIIIDVDKHKETISTLDPENPEIPVTVYPEFSLISSGGVQMIEICGSAIARKRDQSGPVLEKYQFVPYIMDEEVDLSTVIRLCVHIILENTPKINVKTIEILEEEYNNEATLISKLIANTLEDLPMIQADLNILKNGESAKNQNENSQETPIPENLSGLKILNEGLPSDNSCLIAILSNISSKLNILEKMFSALEDNGFIIVKEPISSNISFMKLGLNVCFSRIVNAEERIILLSKIKEMKLDTTSIKVENTSYSWVSDVQKKLTELKPENEKLIVYSEKDSMSGILGFFNCLRREEKGLNTRCFFLMDKNAPAFSLQHIMYKTQFEKNLSHNVYINGQWGSYRHLKLEPIQNIEADHAFLDQVVWGDFSSLRWVEGPLSPHKSSEKRLIHVYYSALNFKDVMVGAGKISAVEGFNYDRYQHRGVIGFEYSGKDQNGIRYMGMLKSTGISNLVESEPALTWKVPDHMTLEDASTVTAVYVTVIYAFFFKINLQRGCSILIHAGSGGVGQAAINICLHYGCKIFTTVGTPEKVKYIREKFPQIPESYIGNSRNTSFEKMIKKETNGKGVDIVLNSLAEDKLHASIRCVGKGGHFIEIGRYDMIKNNPINLRQFLQSVTFHSVQMDDTEAIRKCSESNLRKLHEKVQEMLDTGIIKPIDRTIFEKDQVEAAIRYMAAGKHMGKVIIKIREEDANILTKPLPIRLKAQPQVLCEDKKSYLIIGGLGGFGIELAEWLISRGAKKLILSSRAGVKNGYQSYKLKNWQSYGINVIISTEDVTTETGVKNLLQTANSLGPICAIFNLAVVLKDDPFSQQNEEKFRISAGPKAIATIYLDKLSRRMCPHLEYFVVFSSVSCGRGNAEQTNYGMSNSIMERICEARRADNLPALAIQWGAIGEVGVVADLAEDNLTVVIGGTLQQKVKSCLETLNDFMHQPNPIVSSMIVAEKRSTDTDIITHIANVLGIKDLKTISLNWTLPELGMDSITGAELKQIIEAEFGVFLTPQDMKNMTFGKLYAMKEEKASKHGNKDTQLTQLQSLLNDQFMNIPLVRIPYIDNKMNEEISVSSNSTTFVFPGVEGIAKLVEPMAKNLTIQVLCFQYLSDDIPKRDEDEFFNYFAHSITDRLEANQDFYIIGYSLGAIFALEVVNILEKQGRKGYLWLIDGSPAYIDNIYQFERLAEGVKLNDELMECYVCTNMITLLLPQVVDDEISKHLREAKNWDARKKLCCSILPKQLWGETVIHKVLDNALKGYKDIFNHQCKVESLHTSCTLIRCADCPYELDESYGLSKYFKQPVEVHKIENVDHYSILSNETTAQIIMKNFMEEN